MMQLLVVINAILAVTSGQLIPRNVVGVLAANNGNDVGEWEINEFCPHNTYAVGFDLKVQPYQGLFADDTGLNGMRLKCMPRVPEAGRYYGVIEAYRGEWGDWYGYFECPGDDFFLNGFQQQVNKPGLFDDDTGVNNVNFECRHFEFDVDGHVLHGNGRDDGKWGDWSNHCPALSAICGFETRYHGPDLLGSSAVNDITFYCCDD